MTTITQNGITFSNVYKDSGTNMPDTLKQSTYNSSAATPSDANFPLVNAVDIDWNGAEWPSSTATEPQTINTTGDLINAIKYASQVGGGGRNKI